MNTAKNLKCAFAFFGASTLAACSSVPLSPQVINEEITGGCHKRSTIVNVNEETGEHVGPSRQKLSDKPVYGCQSFYSQLLLIQNASYSQEDRSLTAASLLMSLSTASEDGKRGLASALQLTGQTPKTLLRVVVLDALSMASSTSPENQYEGLSRIMSIHRQDLFPKFGDAATAVVEEELSNKDLTIADIESDLLHGTRNVHSDIMGERQPKTECKPDPKTGMWGCFDI